VSLVRYGQQLAGYGAGAPRPLRQNGSRRSPASLHGQSLPGRSTSSQPGGSSG
jgi:hypothetical protein